MNAASIADSAATFNSLHDYDINAALHLSSIVVRHAHIVQMARKELADPQLELPIEVTDSTT